MAAICPRWKNGLRHGGMAQLSGCLCVALGCVQVAGSGAVLGARCLAGLAGWVWHMAGLRAVRSLLAGSEMSLAGVIAGWLLRPV